MCPSSACVIPYRHDALLGLPDAGLATMTEMHLNARDVANAVAVPVIADADTGYGNALNVIRTVREYVQTGVAGIHIEDQVMPKRCGHVAGKQVVLLEEARSCTTRPGLGGLRLLGRPPR
jgi:2-methylisocitrate lyase-like PEP mutase family enzyme